MANSSAIAKKHLFSLNFIFLFMIITLRAHDVGELCGIRVSGYIAFNHLILIIHSFLENMKRLAFESTSLSWFEFFWQKFLCRNINYEQGISRSVLNMQIAKSRIIRGPAYWNFKLSDIKWLVADATFKRYSNAHLFSKFHIHK